MVNKEEIGNVKFKLTEETLELEKFEGKVFYRIEALRSFGDIKKGDRGGWVESRNNLSQFGSCWIYDNAIVMDDAFVSRHAVVRDHAEVRDSAHITDYAVVDCEAVVTGKARVGGNAVVSDYATVDRLAHLFGTTKIRNNARIESAEIGNSIIEGASVVNSGASVYDTKVSGNSLVSSSDVYKSVIDNAFVMDESLIGEMIGGKTKNNPDHGER